MKVEKQKFEKLDQKQVAEQIDKILKDNGFKIEVNFVREKVLGNGALIYNFIIVPE